MTAKIDVQDIKNRLLNGETPSQLAHWYFEELGINVTRQAISQHRQKLVKEGKLQKGKAGRPPGSYIKKETTKYKTRISPPEVAESLISIADMSAKAEDIAKSAHEAAEAAARKAEAVVQIGGEAIVLVRQAADQAVKRAEDVSNTAKESAESAMKAFSEASNQAINKAEEAAKTAIEASKKAADEATAIAEEAVPNALLKKIFYSWELRVFLVIVVSASIFSAVCLSLGMSLIGR